MLKYHTKENVIQEAKTRGSSANTYRGAINFLKKHINVLAPRDYFGRPLTIPQYGDNAWDRDHNAVVKYRHTKYHTRAQAFCDDLNLETRDIIEARNALRRAKNKAQKIAPYFSAAKRVTPSSAVDRYLSEWDYSPHKRMALFKVDDWVEYSRNETWHVELSVLVIYDRDSGNYNAIRVSPRCLSIDTALSYLKPAEVIKAETAGKKILRQGDMYFIPQTRWNLSEMVGSNHTVEIQRGRSGFFDKWDSSEKLNGKPIYIVHPHHKTLKLTSPHKVRQQITVFGRSHAMTD